MDTGEAVRWRETSTAVNHNRSIVPLVAVLASCLRLLAPLDAGAEAVRERTDWNAVEKMRELIRLTQAPDWAQLSREGIPLLKNPRILAENIQSGREISFPGKNRRSGSYPGAPDSSSLWKNVSASARMLSSTRGRPMWARRLFLEKGYEQTTIQDIVDQLGGLTARTVKGIVGYLIACAPPLPFGQTDNSSLTSGEKMGIINIC